MCAASLTNSSLHNQLYSILQLIPPSISYYRSSHLSATIEFHCHLSYYIVIFILLIRIILVTEFPIGMENFQLKEEIGLMLILENRKLAELKRTAGMHLHVPAGEREREEYD
jgi:hypothetical protein